MRQNKDSPSVQRHQFCRWLERDVFKCPMDSSIMTGLILDRHFDFILAECTDKNANKEQVYRIGFIPITYCPLVLSLKLYLEACSLKRYTVFFGDNIKINAIFRNMNTIIVSLKTRTEYFY